MTKEEWIKSLNREELAQFLSGIMYDCEWCPVGDECSQTISCCDAFEAWLSSTHE